MISKHYSQGENSHPMQPERIKYAQLWSESIEKMKDRDLSLEQWESKISTRLNISKNKI